MSTSAPSPQKVAASRFTKAQLAEWGYSWPPKRGWRAELRRRWEREQRAKSTIIPIRNNDLEELLALQEWL